MTLTDNPQYYVTVLSSQSIHTTRIVKWRRGLSSLKKGVAFNFGFDRHDAMPEAAIYVATSDYYTTPRGTGKIKAEQVFDPER